jgi:HK97 family phage portal protein
MSALDRIAQIMGYTKTQPITGAADWLLAQAQAEQFNIPQPGLPQAQAELYQRLTWVQMAIHAVASMSATTALSVKRLEGEDANDVPNHPFEMLLDKPNPLQSRYEFLESIFAYRALTGNAYLWLNRTSSNRPPSEMWIIPSHSIVPVPDERMYLKGYMYEGGNGQMIPLDLHEVVHFKRFHPLNSFVGLSPVEALATVAVGDMAMSQWNTNFFNKDNAKVPGALAFADFIEDTDWGTLKGDIRREHGGSKRNMMMLRGVGKGGVEWINMAMSQKDMEFLNARVANRAEIFGMFAPGLDSVLAINATEANATAGKATFTELAVWPGLVAVAEKITNDILPAYGPNLRAEFDDIRVTDKAMELQEQTAFERVATIDEIRQKYYQLDPIGDDRGKLLPAEITAGKASQPDVQPDMVEAQAAPALDLPTPKPTPEPTAPDDTAPDPTAKAEDLARFRRWAAKRSRPDADAFKSDHLTYADKAAVLWEMKAGDGDADTMPPFPLTDGPITPEALKRMILQLDPGDDEAEQQIRMEIERAFERELATALKEQGAAVTSSDLDSVSEAIALAAVGLPKVRDILRRRLQQSADLGVSVAVRQFEAIGFGFDWTLANQAAAEWVNRYTFELVRGIQDTTQRRLQTAVSEWITNGDPLSALVRELESTFGRQRARLIASTETTRAYTEGNVTAYMQSGIVTRPPNLRPPEDSHPGCRCWLVLGQNADGEWVYIWKTANDERVCPICGPLHNTEQ